MWSDLPGYVVQSESLDGGLYVEHQSAHPPSAGPLGTALRGSISRRKNPADVATGKQSQEPIALLCESRRGQILERAPGTTG